MMILASMLADHIEGFREFAYHQPRKPEEVTLHSVDPARLNWGQMQEYPRWTSIEQRVIPCDELIDYEITTDPIEGIPDREKVTLRFVPNEHTLAKHPRIILVMEVDCSEVPPRELELWILRRACKQAATGD